MAELKIEYLLATDLVPYENNSRTHSQQQVDQIKRSMSEFGFTNPILLDENNGIIAGHGRLQAAQELGTKLVPTITLKGLTKAQRKAYVIADNQLALNAGWDFDALRIEIEDLDSLDFDLNFLGFNDQELANIIDGLEEITPELKEESYSQIFNLVVSCSDETEQEKIYNELTAKGYKCQVQSL